MKSLKWHHWLLLAIAAGAAIYLLAPSEEKKIRNRLEGLAETLEISGEEHPIASGQRAQAAAAYFRAKIEVRIDLRDRDSLILIDRSDLVEKAAVFRRQMPYFKVRFVDTRVTVAGETAKVSTAAQMFFEKDDPAFEAVELEIDWVKGDGWQIERLKTVEAIEL